MSDPSGYIGQGPYADCQIVAMCNALRWYGLPSPAHPSSAWEELVEIGGATHGAVCCPDEVAEHLGLTMTKIGVKRAKGRAPVMLTVWNPEGGSSLHVVLVVAWDGPRATVVNYRTETGPLVETLEIGDEKPPSRTQRWDKLCVPRPGNVNRRAYLLTPTSSLMREHLKRL